MASGFHYELLSPSSKWSSVVQYYYEVDIDPEMLPDGYLHTILPFIGSEWVIALAGDSFILRDGILQRNTDNYIGTQTTNSQTIKFGSLSKVFVVRFQPYFLTLAGYGSLLNNEVIHAQQIFGSTINLMVDQLRQATMFQQRISFIEDFFEKNLNEEVFASEHIDIIMNVQDLTGAMGDIPLLAKRLGISVRQLERRFKHLLRLTPTEFFKLKRLESALEVYASTPNLTGTQATYIGGFADQSHFINNFRQYLNDTPASFFRNRPFLRRGT